MNRSREVALVVVCVAALTLGACAKSTSTTSSSAPSASAMVSSSPKMSPGMSPMTSATVQVVNNAALGRILADSHGMTLYHFDKDKNGTIACTGACTTTWPPLLYTGTGQPTGTTGLAVVSRPDGTKQVTYKSEPLYKFSGDTKAGDTKGNGFAGFWHVVKVS